MVSIKVGNDTSYHSQIKIPQGNESMKVVDVTKSYNHTYGFDFLELALLIVGILILIELSKVRGIFYYVSLTLQDLVEVLVFLIIIYVILKIISSVIAMIFYSKGEKVISTLENEGDKDVEQKL